MEIFGVPSALLGSQLLVGLINGSFYAVLSLGLAIIFGLLNIINFAHGAQYMMGAFIAWLALTKLNINYWVALIAAPMVVGLFGVILERTMLRKLYKLDHLYGLLLTFGLALIIEGIFRDQFGISGESYEVPEALAGGVNLGFMFLPIYRAWVIVASLTVCFGTWYMIEKTRLGAYLRAGTENSQMVQALGINVPLLITFTYGYGVALAAFAGVLAAPIFQVNPLMGSNLIIVVFAVVVIGGMGSILGSIVTGIGLGLIEGLTRVFYPEASAVVVFVIMVIVLLLRPAGLFGKAA
jgi:branched-chain amino acid transport system permease protein